MSDPSTPSIGAPVTSQRPGIEIREATPNDASRLADVYVSAYAEIVDLGYRTGASDVDAADVREWIDASLAFPVAVHDEEIVAACRIREREDWPVPEFCRLAVHEDWKGEGIGSRLLEHAEGWYRDQGYDRVRMRSYTDHPYLLEMYEKRGYEVISVRELEEHDYGVPTLEKQL